MRRDMNYFFQEAWKYARANSDDPETKHGVVITRGERILSYGTNIILPGVEKTPERLARPELYDWTLHSEKDGLQNAWNRPVSVVGAKMYCPWITCIGCAKVVVASGVEEIIFHTETNEFANQNNSSQDWSQNKALELFEAAEHIRYRFVSGKIFEDDFSIKFRGRDFSP